jgi:hypothetical protein
MQKQEADKNYWRRQLELPKEERVQTKWQQESNKAFDDYWAQRQASTENFLADNAPWSDAAKRKQEAMSSTPFVMPDPPVPKPPQPAEPEVQRPKEQWQIDNDNWMAAIKKYQNDMQANIDRIKANPDSPRELTPLPPELRTTTINIPNETGTGISSVISSKDSPTALPDSLKWTNQPKKPATPRQPTWPPKPITQTAQASSQPLPSAKPQQPAKLQQPAQPAQPELAASEK